MQCLSSNFRWLLQCIFPLPASCLINWPLKFNYLFLDISHMLSNCTLHIRHCEYYIVRNSGFCCISVKSGFFFLYFFKKFFNRPLAWLNSSLSLNHQLRCQLCWIILILRTASCMHWSGVSWTHACTAQEFAGLMHARVRSSLDSCMHRSGVRWTLGWGSC